MAFIINSDTLKDVSIGGLAITAAALFLLLLGLSAIFYDDNPGKVIYVSPIPLAFGQEEESFPDPEYDGHCDEYGGAIFTDDGTFDTCVLDDPAEQSNRDAQCPGIVERWLNDELDILPVDCHPYLLHTPSEEEEEYHHNNTLIYLLSGLDVTEDVFDFERSAFNWDMDNNNITMMVLIGDAQIAIENGIQEDMISSLAEHHGYSLILYDYTPADELVVVLEQEQQQEEEEEEELVIGELERIEQELELE